MLTLENVSLVYQPNTPFETAALKDVSLTIQKGEFLAVIGHTGSGKSTFAQLLNGLLTPTSGRVLLEGQDVHQKGFDKKTLRRRVGMVFQYAENQLFEETVYKDIAFGPKNQGLSEEEISQRVKYAMERVGLGFALFADKSPFDLSGGQMRRVAIAGVLAMQPDLLVLDEPAAGLDPMGRQDMLQMVKGLHEEGRSIVMITHSMDDAARYADRIVVFDHGRAVMQGTVQEVFRDAEKMLSLGLDVPQVYRLSLEIRKKHPDFPLCLRHEDALNALKMLLKGGNEPC